MSNKLRIIFMGTPGFAVASLEAILKSRRHSVIAVITAPDRPASRGLKIQQSAVKEYAMEHNLTVLQPEKLKEEGFINSLKELNPDLIVVVAFRMLPEVIWKLPKLGTINLHASLLPQYRGAAPINWAIINGEEQTGVTTFFINERIDTGDILYRKEVPVSDTDNAGILHDKLMNAGAELLIRTVDEIADKTIKPLKQTAIPASELKTAPKIFRIDCRIDFNKTTEQVYNFIRGLSPYPGAWTEILNTETGKKPSIKIFKTSKHPEMLLPLGKLAVSDNIHIYIGCNDGSIEVLELQPEGKKAMPAADFLRGNRLENGVWKIVMEH